MNSSVIILIQRWQILTFFVTKLWQEKGTPGGVPDSRHFWIHKRLLK